MLSSNIIEARDLAKSFSGVPALRSATLSVVGLAGLMGAGRTVPLMMLAVAAVTMHLLLERTKLGRYSYAMGSNREAARYAGVPLNACTVAIYAILGMLTGLPQ